MDVSDFQFLSICYFFANWVSCCCFISPFLISWEVSRLFYSLGYDKWYLWEWASCQNSRNITHTNSWLLKYFKIFTNFFSRERCAAGDLFAWLKQVWKQLILAKNSCYCPVFADSSAPTKHESEFELFDDSTHARSATSHWFFGRWVECTSVFLQPSPKQLIQAPFFTRSLSVNSIWWAQQAVIHPTRNFLLVVYKVHPFHPDRVLMQIKWIFISNHFWLSLSKSAWFSFCCFCSFFPWESRK